MQRLPHSGPHVNGAVDGAHTQRKCARDIDDLPFRAAPQNLEAEQALLGAILVSNEAYGRVSGFLEPQHFFDPLHAQIYETAAQLITDSKQATPITLKTFFESAEPIGGLSVPAYLGQLAANATTISDAPDYARIVHDLWARRQLILIGEDMVSTAYDLPVSLDPAEQMAKACQRLDSLSRTAPATLRAVTVADLQAMELIPQAYVLEGLLREQGLMMLYGWRGIAKTWLALGLAVAMATGGTYLRWKAPRPRRVLYIDGEMPAIAMRERLDAMLCDLPVGRRGDALQGIRLLSDSLHRDGLPDLASRQGQAALDRILGDAEVVILDNLSTLTRYGDESEADSWRPVQPWLLKLRREGRSVVMVHHAGKGGTQRGTSKREDVLDVVLQLRHPADYEPTQGARFEVHYEKARGLIGDQAAPLEASLVMTGGRATWSWQPLADARDAEILEMSEAGTSIRAIARELRLSKGAVERALKRAKAGR